jgi:NADH-quinone oxidoreductase subunit J
VTEVLFFVAAALAIVTALAIVMLENPFFSVLALVANLIALALLFLLLEAQFVAFAQVVVYAGAVMVLYVFVSAYIGQPDSPAGPPHGLMGALTPLFAGALFVELAIAVVGSGLTVLDSKGAALDPGFGTPGQVGELLLSRFLVPFELASFLLLATAVGALVLAQRRRGLEETTGEAGS